MRQIGKYQLHERIGVGGFGEVFKGFDPFIKRHVAIKTCTSHSEEIRSRFFQEAEIAGNLHHRNITTVYDFGVDDDLPYLIQEYLEGEDLDAKIKRREYLPLAEKMLYLIQVARGLSHAHAEGVMHRDIKPANIRVLADGTTKIMDFGIAKLQRASTGLTQTGMTLGTAAYLSPEQIRGEPVDVRTDIFSFGVSAYELLTYERPFEGDQISAVLYRLLNDAPRPIPELWPAAPPALVALVDRCLAKDPRHRYADGAELLDALEVVQRSVRDLSGLYAQAPPQADAPTRSLTQANPAVGLDELPQHGTESTPALGDIDLDGRATATTPSQKPIAMVAKRRFPLGRPVLALLAGLVAFTAAAGWWLGRSGQEPTPAQPTSTIADAPMSDAPSDHGVPPTDPAAARQPTESPPVAAKPPPPKPEPVAAAPAPPPPKAAPPPPAPRTGALTARPYPRRPHGDVWIDGRWYGTTPLRGVSIDTGRHVLEIRPQGGGDSLRRVIEIAADRETIVTFDFEAGNIRETQKASSSR